MQGHSPPSSTEWYPFITLIVLIILTIPRHSAGQLVSSAIQSGVGVWPSIHRMYPIQFLPIRLNTSCRRPRGWWCGVVQSLNTINYAKWNRLAWNIYCRINSLLSWKPIQMKLNRIFYWFASNYTIEFWARDEWRLYIRNRNRFYYCMLIPWQMARKELHWSRNPM